MEREFSLVTDDVLGHVMAVTIATVCKNEYRTLLSLSFLLSPLSPTPTDTTCIITNLPNSLQKLLSHALLQQLCLT